MTPFRVFLVAFLAFSADGKISKLAGPTEELEALRMWRDICQNGKSEGGMDDKTKMRVFCDDQSDTPIQVEMQHKIDLGQRKAEDQVIIVNPPQEHYHHKVSVEGMNRPAPSTTIYIRPSQSSHNLEINAGSLKNGNEGQNVENPEVTFLGGSQNGSPTSADTRSLGTDSSTVGNLKYENEGQSVESPEVRILGGSQNGSPRSVYTTTKSIATVSSTAENENLKNINEGERNLGNSENGSPNENTYSIGDTFSAVGGAGNDGSAPTAEGSTPEAQIAETQVGENNAFVPSSISVETTSVSHSVSSTASEPYYYASRYGQGQAVRDFGSIDGFGNGRSGIQMTDVNSRVESSVSSSNAYYPDRYVSDRSGANDKSQKEGNDDASLNAVSVSDDDEKWVMKQYAGHMQSYMKADVDAVPHHDVEHEGEHPHPSMLKKLPESISKKPPMKCFPMSEGMAKEIQDASKVTLPDGAPMPMSVVCFHMGHDMDMEYLVMHDEASHH